MMTMLFIALAVSVLAIVGVGVGIFVRVRRKNAAQASAPEDNGDLQIPPGSAPLADTSGAARMTKSDISA